MYTYTRCSGELRNENGVIFCVNQNWLTFCGTGGDVQVEYSKDGEHVENTLDVNLSR